MINPFEIGDVKTYEKIVLDSETASFDSGEVHPFYGTFALARDAEWSSRLFVLEMKEDYEEGIGTYVNIKHLAPALVGEKVVFKAVLKEVNKNNVVCTITMQVGERKIAEGETGQKIITKARLNELEENLRNG
jgi:fluoroacetyl-CoA thioesterase